MDDLKQIIASRAEFYSKADLTFDTSEATQEASFVGLIDALRDTVFKQDKAFF